MKLTKQQAHNVIATLGAIPFFPSDPAVHLVIVTHLEKFVSGPMELDWLLESAIGAMDRWMGIPELRGLYCQRFKPADGIEADSKLPGYTPADNEAREALQLISAPSMALLGDGREPDLEAETALIELAGGPVDLKRMPAPTKADREYSRKLLEVIL